MQKMRGLLLKYMIYDSLIRPDEWHFALVHDNKRYEAWLSAIAVVLSEQLGRNNGVDDSNKPIRVLSIGSSGELPVLPVLAALLTQRKLRDQVDCGSVRDPARHSMKFPEHIAIFILERIQPIAAAINECLDDNSLDDKVTIMRSLEPDSDDDDDDDDKAKESNSNAKDKTDIDTNTATAPVSPPADVLIAPGLEDPYRICSVLEDMVDAVKAGHIHKDTLILPARIKIKAVCLNLPPQTSPVRVPIGDISGFDLSRFNSLRGDTSKPDLMRLQDTKHTRLTEDFDLCSIHLQGDAKTEEGLPATDGWHLPIGEWGVDLPVVCEGECNAVAVWVEADLTPATLTWLSSRAMLPRALSQLPCGPGGSARRQLVYHLDQPAPLTQGGWTGGHRLAVQCERAGSPPPLVLRVQSTDLVTQLLSWANLCSEMKLATDAVAEAKVERWHYAMVNDYRRNDVYNDAIVAAVQRVRAAQGPEGGAVRVLDIGGGSGLLAMMAARAGASHVTTIERISAMAQTAQQVIEANIGGATVQCIQADSSEVTAEQLNGGAGAHIIVSEVLDDGLLGEGVIPTCAHARRHLAAGPSTLHMPAAATVYAMAVNCPPQPAPLQMPAGSYHPIDKSRTTGISPIAHLDLAALDSLWPANQRRYSSVRLDRTMHTPLTAPFSALHFDLDAPLDHPASAPDYSREVDVQVPVTEDGWVNAIAFWFNLQVIRGGTTLCTYPAAEKECRADTSSRCWNQAIQFLNRPIRLHKGQTMRVTAVHSATRVTFKDVKAAK